MNREGKEKSREITRRPPSKEERNGVKNAALRGVASPENATLPGNREEKEKEG